MAEFGDFSAGAEVSDDTITVDMCDYAYIDECNDTKKLNGILNLLRSGKEGFYPEVSLLHAVKYSSSPRSVNSTAILHVL